jgi:hypothetical protein
MMQVATLADSFKYRYELLARIAIHDTLPEDQRGAVLSLPGLESLPALRALHCCGRVPAQAWRCPQLEVLSLEECHVRIPPMPEGDDVVLPALQRLRLECCTLDDDCFPAQLCSLGQLSSLAILDCELHSLGITTAAACRPRCPS